MEKYPDYLKGRGAQINTPNPYKKQRYETEETDGLDEPLIPDPKTQFFYDRAKKILNKVTSPDIPANFSLNPYQGCEHGCVYCYARNTHPYWGYSAGLDFETKIIVKENAPELLRKELNHPKWKPDHVMFAGNTDIYQPIERKEEITRECLKVFLEFGNPVGMITKNSLILRDLDLLKSMAKNHLVHVFITITTLDEKLRRAMEPRTASALRRLETVRQLADNGIPVGVMMGPIIPGLSNHEIPELAKAAAEAGAQALGYSLVRLNGDVKDIFEDWITKNFPDRAEKVLSQIRASRGGELGDSEFGRRMKGEGPMASSISDLFKLMKKKYFADRKLPEYNVNAFRRPNDRQLSLF